MSPSFQKFSAGLFITALLVTPSAFATASESYRNTLEILHGLDPDASPRKMFDTVDINRDGKVSRVEFDNRKTDVFYLRDKNRDLKLSRDEFKTLSEQNFKAADLNGDGLISGYEFIRAPWTKFEIFDVNTDGFITYEELLAFKKRMK